MEQQRTGDPLARIRVCVDDFQCGEPIGSFRTVFLPGEIPFTGVISLVEGIRHYMDTVDFPQALTRLRQFSGQADEVVKIETEVPRYMDDSSLEIKSGKKSTFVVQILFRQNSTWQGTVTWTEKGETQKFRSTLELLKLIDSAVDIPGDETHWEK